MRVRPASSVKVLQELGRRWEQGRMNVLQEHVASEKMRRALVWCAQGIPVTPGAPLCLLAMAEGDDHTMGLSLAELCGREAGWTTRWAGCRTPLSDLEKSIAQGEVQAMALSASVASADPVRLLAQVTELSGPARQAGVLLVLGGQGAWPEDPPYGSRLHRFESFFELLVTAARRA